MALQQYGFLEEQMKSALRADRKEARVGNRADKVPVSKRIKLLEEKLVDQVLSFAELSDIQAELRVLRRR